MRTIMILCILYVLGLFGYWQFGVDSALISFAGGFSLLAITCVLLAPERKNKTLLSWFFIVSIAGFLIEVLGVKTGLIFGEYQYGNGLGIKLFEVPIVIGLNWGVVVLGSLCIAGFVAKRPLALCTVSALLAVFLDLVLEAVAHSLDYWHWEIATVPAQNYLAWFVVAFGMSWFFIRKKVAISQVTPFQANYLMQYVFFTILLIFIPA